MPCLSPPAQDKDGKPLPPKECQGTVPSKQASFSLSVSFSFSPDG